MSETSKGLHLIVHGVVQGVGFRWYVERTARNFGLTGWVKNVYDGTVECYAEGGEGALHGFLKDINIGPSGSRVTKVEPTWKEATGEYKEFRITF